MQEDSVPLDVIPAALSVEQTAATAQPPGSIEVVRVEPVQLPAPGAVPEADRIQAIDVLRGFALLGILVMNIQSFSMIMAAYENPTAYGNLEGANYWVWFCSRVLADQKFMTIFSMLFGAGIVLMTSRQEETEGRSAAVHYRRMGVLALFGLLHAYLFWLGDILFSYALAGMLAYLLRKLRPLTLIVLGFVSLLVPALLMVIGGLLVLWLQSLPAEQQGEMTRHISLEWRPSPERVAAEVSAYQEGWVAEFKQRWVTALLMQTVIFLFGTLWRSGGLMLVGMGLFKRGVFSAGRSKKFYVILIAVALGVGVPIELLGVHVNQQRGWDVQAQLLNGQFNYWASILISLGWVGVIMLWCRQPRPGLLRRALAAVGQMALTNYLLHTLICTTIFYGHGFGYFGQVERVGQIEIVFAIWAFQLILSPIWLHFFRFGPAEWLWRGLTYLRFPPLLRTEGAVAH
jgi:uncharacterized protein